MKLHCANLNITNGRTKLPIFFNSYSKNEFEQNKLEIIIFCDKMCEILRLNLRDLV